MSSLAHVLRLTLFPILRIVEMVIEAGSQVRNVRAVPAGRKAGRQGRVRTWMAPIGGAWLVAPVGGLAAPVGRAVRSSTAGAVTLDGFVTLIGTGTVTGFGAGAVTITGMGALSVAARGMARILRSAAHSGSYRRPNKDRKKKLAPHCSYQDQRRPVQADDSLAEWGGLVFCWTTTCSRL